MSSDVLYINGDSELKLATGALWGSRSKVVTVLLKVGREGRSSSSTPF